jgi:tRNA threonylcarbamoyl adenosine modification protein YeaZ
MPKTRRQEREPPHTVCQKKKNKYRKSPFFNQGGRMNILIIDTTREILLTVLLKDDKVFVRKSLSANSRYMSLLFVKIDEILREAGLSVSEIDYYAGVVGPGSYTGIRIGICALTAMAKAQSKKLVSINSLEILAYKNAVLKEFLCVIDNGHDYYALEQRGGERKYSVLQKNAVEKYKNVVERDENDYYIAEMSGLVGEKILSGEYGETMTPFYMKKSQAGQGYSGIIDSGNGFIL